MNKNDIIELEEFMERSAMCIGILVALLSIVIVTLIILFFMVIKG